MKFIYKFSLLIAASFFAINANAGVVTQFTSAQSFQRNCPGLQDPNYVNKWQGVVESLYGLEPGTASTSLMCHFNGGNQERIFNQDGTFKDESAWSHLPPGHAYSLDDVGTLDITAATGSDSVMIGDISGEYYADITLDTDNLGLPEMKLKAGSDPYERNSLNVYAATEYLWVGENTTLEYTANFDLFTSGEQWNLPGLEDQNNYIFNLAFGAYTDMLFDINQVFPVDYGIELASGSFRTSEDNMVAGSEDNPYEDTITVSFDVQTGDQFFLYGQAQAFGLNGGFTDASHTITTSLAIEGLSQDESENIFASSLQAAVPTSIPEPSTILLIILSLSVLYRSRMKTS